MPRVDAIRQISVTEQTYYYWSAGGNKISVQWTVVPPIKHGGMGMEQLKETEAGYRKRTRRPSACGFF